MHLSVYCVLVHISLISGTCVVCTSRTGQRRTSYTVSYRLDYTKNEYVLRENVETSKIVETRKKKNSALSIKQTHANDFDFLQHQHNIQSRAKHTAVARHTEKVRLHIHDVIVQTRTNLQHFDTLLLSIRRRGFRIDIQAMSIL